VLIWKVFIDPVLRRRMFSNHLCEALVGMDLTNEEQEAVLAV